MVGPYRSGAVNGCVCAGFWQIVKCCLFPRVEINCRERYVDACFQNLSLLSSTSCSMVFWSFSRARLNSGRLNFILPPLRPFSWFCFFLLILFSHLRVASPSFTSSVSVAFVLLFTFSAQIFFPPFPSVIVPFFGSLLPPFLHSV